MKKTTGFTLIEMIMVITITGIIAGMVAVFIRAPVEGYVDSVRRAELTDQADVALRRITRDVRLALPNSLRVATIGNTVYIEFIMTSDGGRYRDASDGSTGGTPLSFTNAGVTTFDVLGAMPAMAVGDFIVGYNLGTGFAPADAYRRGQAECDATPVSPGCNIAQVTGIAGNVVTLDANPFAVQAPPLPSPSARFQVVPGGIQAVTYECPTAAAGAGNLNRRWAYGFNPVQAAPAGGNTALLAANAVCEVNYVPATATARNGLLYIRVALTTGGETVALFNQIHVDNTP